MNSTDLRDLSQLPSLLDGFAAQNAAKRAELHRSARLPIARIAKRVANRIGYRFGQHFKRLFFNHPRCISGHLTTSLKSRFPVLPKRSRPAAL